MHERQTGHLTKLVRYSARDGSFEELFLNVSALLLLLSGLTACNSSATGAETVDDWLLAGATLDEATYRDKVHGSWIATMVANHSGLPIEGIWLDEPGPGDSVDLVLLDQWSTDDDTHVEWLDLHILETYGLSPTYEQIRDEWVDHLNGDIWVATRAARDLMDDGVLPPATGSLPLNPDGPWAMDAQLETELFGLINPGRPIRARDQAQFFARVTSSGPAVDASAFYAHLYSIAFGASDVSEMIGHARRGEPEDSIVAPDCRRSVAVAMRSRHVTGARSARRLVRRTTTIPNGGRAGSTLRRRSWRCSTVTGT